MTDQSMGKPQIAVVLGTGRPGNFTSKALALVIDEIDRNAHFDAHVIDPAGMALPLPGTDADSAEMKALRETALAPRLTDPARAPTTKPRARSSAG